MSRIISPTLRAVFYGCVFLFFSCSGKKIDENTVLAKVGSAKIRVKDFRISYELATVKPGMPRPKSVSEKKRNHLHTMIEDKLLTFAGLDRGLDREEDVQRLVKWYEKQAVIRQLYREEIRKRVEVSEEEMRQAFKLLNERVQVRQILIGSRAEAKEIYARVRKGARFEEIAADVAHSDEELKHMLTPREFTWGELDENLETALFGLNKNEISAPIHTRSGYHIVQLVNRKENMMLTEYDYQQRQHYIETIIRRRKEAKLARAYAMKLMERLHPRAVGPVLLELTKRAKKAMETKSGDKRGAVPPYLQVHQVRPQVEDLLDKNLVLFDGGSWTVGEFLALIEHAHPESRPDLTNPGKLKVALSVMVRDEFLAAEGYKRGLANRDAVKEEVAQIRDDVVAMRMKSLLLDSVQVSRAEVRAYFEKNIGIYQTPQRTRVQEVMVRDRRLADSLYQAIREGAHLNELARTFSVRKWAAKKGGDLGFITEKAFGEVGKRANEMPIGELSEPVPIKVQNHVVGYSVFRVIDRKPVQSPQLEDVFAKVSRDALRDKKNRILGHFLAETEERYPISADETILSSIKTTDELGLGRPMELLRVSRL